MISAVILAAGASGRMGRPKQELVLGSQTVLSRVVSTFLRSRVGEVVVVVQPGHRRLVPQSPKVKLVLNSDQQRGMSWSLRLGLNQVTGDAAIIGLGDQPLVSVRTINALISAYLEGGAKIVVPTCDGERGNPVLFDRALFGQILRLKGDRGAKSVVLENEGQVKEVEVGDKGILLDIDTPEDLRRIRMELRSRKREARQ